MYKPLSIGKKFSGSLEVVKSPDIERCSGFLYVYQETKLINMEEWKSVNQESPEFGVPVLCSVKRGNEYYKEVLAFDGKQKLWKHNNGDTLDENSAVVGWKSAGSTFLG